MDTLLKKCLGVSLIIILLLTIKNIEKEKNKEFINEVTYSYSDSYNEEKCKNILIIPKINLNKCMNYNDVNKDIAVLYEDKTIVLAAHSGTGPLAFFKDLYKLTNNDEVIFYHAGKKKIYRVDRIESKLKSDELKFKNIENQLILITCSYTHKNKQNIYFLLEN